MSEPYRAFGLGADIVSVTCLVVPGAGSAPRLEIPPGSRGTIVEVPRPGSHKPYSAVFAVRGMHVEAEVTEEQMTLDALVPSPRSAPDDMPPLIVRHPDRRTPHVPSLQYPHRLCRVLHPVSSLLLSGLYVVVLMTSPATVIPATLLAIVVLYGHQLIRYREWSWVPLLFRHDTPEVGEYLATSPAHLTRAVRSDVLFAAATAAVLLYRFWLGISHLSPSPTLYIGLSVLVFVAGVERLRQHDRAARILPKGTV